jgi:transposase
LKELDRQVKELEQQIRLWHEHNEAGQRLTEIPGIGPVTASALVVTIVSVMPVPLLTLLAIPLCCSSDSLIA